MRNMNCKSIVRSISFYVAGDLVGESERAVAVHLLACEDCQRLAEEFSESDSLLARACSPPEFGAEFYSGIRSAVLADIGSRRSRPSLFRPRWLYATAFAAVLIASGLTLQYLSGVTRRATQDVALAPAVKDQPTSNLAGTTNLSSLLQSDGPSGKPKVHGKLERAKRLVVTDSAPAARTERAQIARVIESPAGVGPVAPESTPVAGRSASSPQVSRIEIQTTNPNIRIIWLTPREPQEAEETNRDHNQHENGTRK